MAGPPVDRLDNAELGSLGRYRVYIALVSVASSVACLLRELWAPRPTRKRPSHPRHTLSPQAAVSSTLEALLLLAALAGNRDGNTTGDFGHRLADSAIWAYALLLFLVRLLPPPGLDRIRRTAWQHSFLLSALSGSISISTLHDDARDYLIPCCLLATLLLSPAPTQDDATDTTGEYSSGMIGLLGFFWMDGMLFGSWKRGRLGVSHVPKLNRCDSAAANVADFGRERSRLLPRLLRRFGPELTSQGLLAALSGVLVFLPTLLIGLVLQYVEDTSIAPGRQATHYVVLIFLASILASAAQGHASWMGKKTGLRVRSVLASEIYEKALRLPFAPTQSATSSSPTDAGAVMNLFTGDVDAIASSAANVHQLWASVPAQILTSMVLLYSTLGASSLVGVALMAMMVPLNSRIAHRFGDIQGRVMAASDARLQSTSELIRNIRVIKLMAWESYFCRQVGDKRADELRALRSRFILWSLAATIWYTVPLLITFSSFFTYAIIAGRPLTPSLAFKSLSLFNLLKMPLDDFVGAQAQIQTTLTSLERLDKFLVVEETEKYRILGEYLHSSDLGFAAATFAWPGGQKQAGAAGQGDSSAAQTTQGFMLRGLDVRFLPGKLNVIIGSTGSGKSSMLLALLGEMPLVSGQVYMGFAALGGRASKAEAGTVSGIALCAQEPWLLNDTVRNNILFGKPFDQIRYDAVVEACALGPDLSILSGGDSSPVGEGGLSLSGGQKQRIALARAVYSDAHCVLLDDCLSAVDAHTGSWIFYRCIRGALMKGRTCILVTNNTQLAVPDADYVVKLERGATVAAGSPRNLWDQGHIPEITDLPSDRAAQLASRSHQEARPLSETPPDEQGDRVMDGAAPDISDQKPDKSRQRQALRNYLAAMGGRAFWALLVSSFIAQQAGSMMTNWWVRELTNAYTNAPHGSLDASKASYYFGVYVIFLLAYVAIGFARLYTLSLGSLAASARIHDSLLRSITSATLRFFDGKSFGGLINVFGAELRTVDQDVAVLAIATLHFAGALAGISILIAFITPSFVLPGIGIGIGYYLIGAVYITASRDLKTIESDRRSPLVQHIGETLTGALTIRAYGVEKRYFDTTLSRLDDYNQLSFFVEGIERWLVLRLGLAGAFVSLFAGLFAVNRTGNPSPGTIGLSLTYAIVFSEHVLWLVRYHSANTQNMTSLYRIQEYVELPEAFREREGSAEPPRDWPSRGVVEYKDVSARYAPTLDHALRNLTFTTKSRERLGIVGRTGAGKSSLVLSLLGWLEIDEGQILIDGIDTRDIDLGDLRKGLAFVPQDPTLFSGSLRDNLDPFQEYTDEEVVVSLRKVGLLDSADQDSQVTMAPDSNKLLDLSFTLSGNGSNISRGQRQLVCIARALLKQSPIIILDEATASVDLDSDMKIQACIRNADSTVITIAHRLGTVIDYGRILTLDAGTLMEDGHPWQLLQRNGGIFKGMCDAAVDGEELRARAKAAWQSK